MGAQTPLIIDADIIPKWVPQAAQRYLRHTKQGISIRAVARDAGCHASTILRQIRRYENRRDDPLVDEALRVLGHQHFSKTLTRTTEETPAMSAPIRHIELKTDDVTLNR